jgi:hypothetical protein
MQFGDRVLPGAGWNKESITIHGHAVLKYIGVCSLDTHLKRQDYQLIKKIAEKAKIV